MNREARIVTSQVDNTPYYVLEIFDDKKWEWAYGFPIENYGQLVKGIDHKVISTKMIDKIMTLLMQGYTIYDER